MYKDVPIICETVVYTYSKYITCITCINFEFYLLFLMTLVVELLSYKMVFEKYQRIPLCLISHSLFQERFYELDISQKV